ncbi:MAG TPA: sigma-54 dependent transcriptional regulator [Candidatus Eisenbacteria bacterium]|nr:sigma-54 dependent transcriptional regulator [Candidatus Eisenbacteria bacterium]
MSESRVLLVDDEESFRQIVGRELRRAGYHVDEAGTVEDARHSLAGQSYHVVLLDVRLPDGSGLDLLQDIKQSLPATQVVILTAFGTVREAIRAMKHGAFDFLSKPCKLGEIEAVIEKALEVQSLERGHAVLQRDLERLQPSERIVGETPGIREVHRLIERVAQTDSTVLIRGESGVGKELVARAVHRQSRRTKQPFVVVDCASLHENLLQSELFGHEKGAYTGAVRLKHGLFEVADKGTIFLDEIGEVTPPLQVKLLRVLETGIFRRVGGTADVRVDVRVIAATNRALENMMQAGAFREDLYYRLNVFTIPIPPLRERREDIPLLVAHFVRNSAIVQKRNVQITAEAMEVLARYPWPGNARELANVVERALILCEGDRLLPENLPIGIRRSAPETAPMNGGQRPTLEEAERRYILQILDECGGHRQKAATILGISERNLYRKLKQFGVSGPREAVHA